MRCLFIGLLNLALITVSQADTGGLEQRALAALGDALRTEKPVYLSQVIGRIAAETGEQRAVVRQHLLVRLEHFQQTLDQHRQNKSDYWKDVLALRRDGISSKQGTRVLFNLIEGSCVALGTEKEYLLPGIIRRAALDAKVKRQSAHAYLQRLVDKALTSGDSSDVAQQFGLLVSGHTNRFEVNKDPLFIFFRTQDEAFVLEEVREMQRFILPRLVRVAAQQPTIQYAIRKRQKTVLVRPEYHLVIGVDNLRFTGSNANLRPCLEAKLELVELPSQDLVWGHDFSFCTDEQGSKIATNLHPFFDELAVRISEELNEVLEDER